MATQADLRQIALSFPGVQESADGLAFEVPVKGKLKGFAWAWKERIEPKKAKVANRGVFAIVVPNLATKDMLMESDPDKFVLDPHYNGFPAVLARLDAFGVDDLEDLLIEAWRTKATKDLLAEFDQKLRS